MTTRDFLVILRDCVQGLTWAIAVVFFMSGCQDVIYDVGAVILRGYRRFVLYRAHGRLTAVRLRSRDQQQIAVIVPAWNEGEVVATMVDNIIKRVEYENYRIFVGTYPNDPATQNAVDRLAKEHPRIIKVVTTRPGPTTKADCLNNVYRALKAYEAREGTNFDIIVMHDAEDFVHPQSFLLYNYLIPKVDVIQLPILPLPSKWNKWVHWVYADEFAENHMKDVPVREKISRFVPFAGTGTGFSRRVFYMLENRDSYHIFNESSMTEDYSMSKKIREAGLKVAFVNVVLEDDPSPFWVPLCKRPYFISNWAYFPMDFNRSVRQKTRWIIGISLQEWESGGWKGSWRMRENLVKDRKVFLAATASFLGYFVLLYLVLYGLGEAGYVPFKLLPALKWHTPLTNLVAFCSIFMVIRMLGRVLWVGMVYGLGPGLLSIPRLALGNVINGLASFRALQAFALSRQGRAAVKWDNTTHLEGVGELPTVQEVKGEARSMAGSSVPELIAAIRSGEREAITGALDGLPADLPPQDRLQAQSALGELAHSSDLQVRSAVTRAIGRLDWAENAPALMMLLQDPDWIVRSNAARALLSQPSFERLLEQALLVGSEAVVEVVTKCVEQDDVRQREVFALIAHGRLPLSSKILLNSAILRQRYEGWAEVGA